MALGWAALGSTTSTRLRLGLDLMARLRQPLEVGQAVVEVVTDVITLRPDAIAAGRVLVGLAAATRAGLHSGSTLGPVGRELRTPVAARPAHDHHSPGSPSSGTTTNVADHPHEGQSNVSPSAGSVGSGRHPVVMPDLRARKNPANRDRA